jgi:hypothetical protein
MPSRLDSGWDCRDCGLYLGGPGGPDYYMLKSSVWKEITTPQTTHILLCWACAQKRAKRPLELEDMLVCRASGPRYTELMEKRKRRPLRRAARVATNRIVSIGRHYRSDRMSPSTWVWDGEMLF